MIAGAPACLSLAGCSRDRHDACLDELASLDPQHADSAAGLAAAIGGRTGIEDPEPFAGLIERYVRVIKCGRETPRP